jgi:predicted Zn-dependent peptidase
VKNERRQRYDNVPYGTSWEHLFAMTFPEGHPYHHMPIGSMEDLEAASLEDVRAFFTTYYHPGNAVLTLVGDVDAQTGSTLAKQYFGWIAPQPVIPTPKDGTVPPLTAPVRRELRESVPAEAYYAMHRAPQDGTPELDALEVAATVLGGTDSSRLTQRLVRADQTAQQVGVGVQRLIGGASTVYVIAHARSGASLDDLEAGLLDEVALLAGDGPTEEELEIAKAALERRFLDQTSTCAGLADLVSETATLFGDVQQLNGKVDRINAVTAADVRAAVATWMAPQSRAVLTYRIDPTPSASGSLV